MATAAEFDNYFRQNDVTVTLLYVGFICDSVRL